VNSGGGGIYNAAPGVLRLFGSSVISNAGYQGGGLHVAGGTVMLDHSSVFSNVVTNAMAAGGGLYIDRRRHSRDGDQHQHPSPAIGPQGPATPAAASMSLPVC
jgi:hypothetical protein